MARRKPPPAEKRRPIKKKVSILATENITYIDYKDVDLLRRFMSERAKIRGRRVTGNTAQQQREVARAIRVAREMALLPYAVRQVTTRRGGRRDRDREPRGPEGAPPPPPGGPEGATGDAVLDNELPEGVTTEAVEEIAVGGGGEGAAAEEVAAEVAASTEGTGDAPAGDGEAGE